MSRYLEPKLKSFLKVGFLYGFHTLSKCIKKQEKKISFNINNKDTYKILIKRKKIRLLYGITQKQLKKNLRQKNKSLFNLLERRLDCLVFRLGFATSISAARQLILHKHINVNNKLISYPGYKCQLNDIVSLKSLSKYSFKLYENFENFQQTKFENLETLKIFENFKLINFSYFPNFFKLNLENNYNPQMHLLPKTNFT